MKTGRDHPSLDIVGSHGTELAGKRIVLCVAGSVAAYKAIELARLLMRHGADVTCVASPAATSLIRPDYFEWATGNDVVTKLTGKLEHVQLADYGRSDAIVVYPATANTLGKLANGIDDTPVSAVLTVGLGAKIPIIMCLAMHEAMYENAAVKRNILFLKDEVSFVSPNVTEGKAKAPEPEDVLDFVLRKFGRSGVLAGKRVLMTAGPTVEHIDPVRVITNTSSGRTGVSVARELVSAGASVTMIYGPGSQSPPAGIRVISVRTTQEMADALGGELGKKFDVVIIAAAAADYTPKNPSGKKIKSSESDMQISLRRVPKMINQVRALQRDALLVGFKAEADVSRADLVAEARRKIAETGADFVVANDIGTKRYRQNPACNEVVIVDSDTAVPSGWKPKEEIAGVIVREIERRIA